MPGDINATGLSIALELDTVLASKSLNALIDQVRDFEGDLVDAAQAALNNVTSVSDASQNIIRDFTGLQKDVLDNYAKGYTEISKQVLERQKDLDLLKEQQKELHKKLQLYDELKEVTETIYKEGQKEFDTSKDVTNSIKQTEQAIYAKNKAHGQQNDLMMTGDKIAKAIWHTHKWMGDEVKRIAVNLVGQLAALLSIANTWRAMVMDTERFVTANYRAYDTQVAMVAETYRIAGAYGIAREKAILAYKAMADIRVPRDQMEKMTVAVAQFHRVTGVGIDVTARFIKNLRAVGYTSVENERALTGMANKMRQFGLTTEDVTQVLNEMPDAYTFEDIFGKGSFEKFAALRAEIVSIGKELGTSSDAAMRWGQTLTQSGLEGEIARQKLGQALGMEIKTVEDISAAYLKAGEMAKAMYDAELARTGNAGLARATMERQMEVIAGMDAATVSYVKAMAEANEKNRAGAHSLSGFNEHMRKSAHSTKTLTELFEEANKTIPAALESIGSSFNAIFGTLIEPIMPILIGMLQALAYVLGKVAAAAQWVSTMLDGMKKSSNVFVMVLGYGLQTLIALAFLFSFRLFGIFGWLGRLIGLILGLGTVAATTGNTIITVFGNVFRALQTLIVGVFQTIGMAIRALLTPLRGLGGQMLLFSVFVLAVAAAIWIVAQAIKTVAEVGDAAGRAVVYLAGGTLILVAALGALAAIAVVAAAPLLALGLAMIPLGVGVLIFSAAMVVASKAFEIFANAMIKLVDENFLPRFGTQLVEAAATVLRGGLDLIGAAGVLAVAAAELAVAVGVLAATAVALSAAAVPIMTGAGVLLGASILVLGAATMFALAMDILAPAGEKFRTVAASLLESGPAFVAGAGMLAVAGTLMIKAAFALMAGSIAILVPLWAFGKVVAKLAKMAPEMATAAGALGAFADALGDLNLSAEALTSVNAGLQQFVSVAGSVYDSSVLLMAAMSNVRYAIESLYYINFFSLVMYIRFWTDQIIDSFREITRIDFAYIADKLESGIQRVGRVFGALGDLQVKADLQALQEMLTEYARYVEMFATKLEAIQQNRIAPLINSLRNDIKETVEAEAFHTVKVLHTVRDAREDKFDKMVALQEQNNILLTALAEIVKGKTAGEEVKNIHELLREHLPEMAENRVSSDGMASDMTKNWVT